MISGAAAKGPGPGRPKGSKNKIAGKTRDEIMQSGETPLQFLIRIMRDDDKELGVRVEAAKCAAPYVHPRLASIDVNGRLDSTVVIVHDWRGKNSEG